MARTLVLHVGLPKCGSTTLQDAMAASGDVLAEHGVRFVRLRPTKLINALAAGERTDEWPAILGPDLPPTVVLSSEFLCTLPREGIAGLLAGLPGGFRRFHVVFVLRDLDDWVLSRLNQQAQGLPGGADDPDAPVAVGMDVGDPDSWLATWARWVAAGPKSRTLTVLPLLGDRSLPERFLAAIGRPDVPLAKAATRLWSNRSIDDRALDLIATTQDLAELLRKRNDLASIREDDDVFLHVKRIISLAKAWERPAGAPRSARSVAQAEAEADVIRERIQATLPDPLREEVLGIVGAPHVHRSTARAGRAKRPAKPAAPTA
jgi:hypothetical protein